MLDHSEGRVPVRLLLLSFMNVSCVMFAHDTGKVPTIPLPGRDISLKSPVAVQARTAYQLQIGTDGSPHPLLFIHPVVVLKKSMRRA